MGDGGFLGIGMVYISCPSIVEHGGGCGEIATWGVQGAGAWDIGDGQTLFYGWKCGRGHITPQGYDGEPIMHFPPAPDEIMLYDEDNYGTDTSEE